MTTQADSKSPKDQGFASSHCSSSFERGTQRFAVQLVDAYSPIEWDEWLERMDAGFKQSGMQEMPLRDLQRLAHELHSQGQIILDESDPEWPILRRARRDTQQADRWF